MAEAGLTWLERVMLIGTPLSLLVPAAAVPVLYLHDSLRRGRIEGWELGAFVGAPLAVAALLALALAWVLRGLDLRLFVYEDGYAHRYRRRERFVPFESIAALVDDSSWMSSGGARGALVPSFRIDLLDGDRLSVQAHASFSALSPNARRAGSIYGALVKAYGASRGARDLERIAAGEPVAYGRLAADREELRVDERRLAWSAVVRVRREPSRADCMTIVIETRSGEAVRVPAREVPDHPAFMHVCGAKLRR